MSSMHTVASASVEGAPLAALPLHIVVMGVSGCGKSTVGSLLAGKLALRYLDGDELHSARNVALMAAGTPLTDNDRRDWLDTVAQALRQAQPPGIVVACSALKRSYRDRLRSVAPDITFVHLHGTPELLAARLAQRTGHYMPSSLLQSQLLTLEAPAPDEAALAADINEPPQDIVQRLVPQLKTLHRAP